MADRWIVSDHRFHEHKSLGSAATEATRLQGLFPQKRFRLYRIKKSLRSLNAKATIVRLEANLKDTWRLISQLMAWAYADSARIAQLEALNNARCAELEVARGDIAIGHERIAELESQLSGGRLMGAPLMDAPAIDIHPANGN